MAKLKNDENEAPSLFMTPLEAESGAGLGSVVRFVLTVEAVLEIDVVLTSVTCTCCLCGTPFNGNKSGWVAGNSRGSDVNWKFASSMRVSSELTGADFALDVAG